MRLDYSFLFCNLQLWVLIFSSSRLVLSLESRSLDRNFTSHLEGRLRRAKAEIAKEYLKTEDDIESVSYDIKWEKLRSERLMFSEVALAVSMFDKMFILEGNRTTSVDVKSASNDTNLAAPLRQAAFMRQGRSINFAKSIVWKSRLYLLVCEKNDCYLYIGEDDSHLELGQTLNHRKMFDATFFTRDNRLYLIVTHDKTDEFLGSSTIYHWTGTYMDIIQPIETVGDVLVTTFNYGRSTIIVFGKSASDLVGLEIYSFDENKIERAQYLPTNGPISIIPYRHDRQDFLLVVNEREASSVYWWDGSEFLHWLDLSDIVAPNRVNVVQFNGDTLFFVSYERSVLLYKVTRFKYWRLDLLDFGDGSEKVIDMTVRIDEKEKLLTMLLVTFEASTNSYRIEPWTLSIKKNRKDKAAGAQDAVDKTEHCLSELKDKLKDQMIAMENVTRDVWPLLHGSEDDITDTGSLVVEELVLESPKKNDSIKIHLIEIVSPKNSTKLLSTNEMREIASSTAIFVSSILNNSRKTLRINEANYLKGDVSIKGNGNFHELETNSIRTSNFNEHEIKLEDFSVSAISATKNQNFSNLQLRGNEIVVRHFEIDQLCGIPYKYWLRRENEESYNIFVGYNLTDVKIANDTIFVQSARELLTMSLESLELRTIDGVNITDLLNNIFIIGEKQVIKGNIVHQTSGGRTLNVANLVAEKLNGIPTKDLITRTTEQNIEGHVFVNARILIKDILTRKINGVPITDFAMVSKKNRFTGKLTLAKLIILDNLTIVDPSKFPIFRPTQIYESVTIIGNVKAKNIVLEEKTNFSLSSMLNTMDKYWTKSTNQTVKNDVRFDNGLSIDELTVNLLNDIDPNEDVVLTNVREINGEFHSLEFENFTAMRIIVESSNEKNTSSPQSLYEDSHDSLIINEEIRIERLTVTELYIEKFNGVPVDVIMMENLENSNSSSYTYSDINSIQKFDTLIVNNRFEMENLYFQYVKVEDGERVRVDDEFLRNDRNYTIGHLKSEKLFLGDIIINEITGSDNDDITGDDNCYTRETKNNSRLDTSNDCSRIIIEGDALIENDLEVFTINDKSCTIYFDELISDTIIIDSNDRRVIDNLTIRQDLTLNFLRGVRFDDIYEKTFSKSRKQNMGDSKIAFFEISVDDLQVKRINNREMEDLILIDSYDINFQKDIVFSDLIVSSLDSPSKPDIRTKYLNGYSTTSNELYEKLGNIESQLLENLTVRGNISWQQASTHDSGNLTKLETILKYSLLQNNSVPCVINTNDSQGTVIKSSTGISIASMKSNKIIDDKRMINGIDVEKILRDSVLDDWSIMRKTNVTKIDGEKIFKNGLRCNRLIVLGDIDIEKLNEWNIDDLKNSIIRLNSSSNENLLFSNLNSTVIFRDSIKTRKLEIKNANEHSNVSSSFLVHGSPISGVFTIGIGKRKAVLPELTHFEHLVVLNDVSVKSLDSVDFDDFNNNRVSLTSTSKKQIVHGNIQFNGVVRVTENARVDLINGIPPSDFVLNNSSEDQIIESNETLIAGDLIINGKTFAPLVAGINLTEAYNNAVLNDEQVEIFGDIIFEADIEKSLDRIGTSDNNGVIDEENLNRVEGGFVNGIELENYVENRKKSDVNFFNNIARMENELEEKIARISSIRLPEIFYYFEREKYLTINDAASVERVRVTSMEKTTILSLYTKEPGGFCGLPNNECNCRGQYVAEIHHNQDNCQSWKVHEPRIFYHFHEAKGAFAVNIATNTVSNSQRCTLYNKTSKNVDEAFSEFTTISWMRNEQESLFLHRRPSTGTFESNVTKDAVKVYGYLSDVAVFTENDLVFIVLAIYYDPILATHRTNSFVYVLDLSTNTLKLFQCIPTSYAFGVEAFHIPSKGNHIFFSSFADGIPTESVLYRLDPHATQFQLLRTFPNDGNRLAKIVSHSNEKFLILDNVATNSINIYRYQTRWDNFNFHQSIYHDSMAPVTSIETFYTGEFRHNQLHIIVTTERDGFFIYEYNFMGNFQLITRKRVSGILSMIPFDVGNLRYIFVGTDTNSTILRIIEQGVSREGG